MNIILAMNRVLKCTWAATRTPENVDMAILTNDMDENGDGDAKGSAKIAICKHIGNYLLKHCEKMISEPIIGVGVL